MKWYDVALRLTLSVIIGLIIGIEREHKSKPAGTRTHMLVCVGAAIIAIMENLIMDQVLLINAGGETGVSVSMGRISAQVVSGIGFLGAGTIFSNHQKIAGLTTAASLWCAGCLGLAVGMGYCYLALAGCGVVMITLALIGRIIPSTVMMVVEVQYQHRNETQTFIRDAFSHASVDVMSVDFHVEESENQKLYTGIYHVKMPNRPHPTEALAPLSEYKNIRLLKIHQQQ